MLDTFVLCCIVFASLAFPCRAYPFDLAALKTFNSTTQLDATLPTTSLVNITNALEGIIGCYGQAPPHQSQMSRTNFKDCFNAEQKLAAHDTHKPMHFRRNSDSAFMLPNSFVYRTCIIYLDMLSAYDEDYFYVGQITEVAIDIARRCTAIPRKF